MAIEYGFNGVVPPPLSKAHCGRAVVNWFSPGYNKDLMKTFWDAESPTTTVLGQRLGI